jgi:hypothetical protein
MSGSFDKDFDTIEEAERFLETRLCPICHNDLLDIDGEGKYGPLGTACGAEWDLRELTEGD